jgi:succinate dehydrogenase / fumarate reductase cytochrome b subunit
MPTTLTVSVPDSDLAASDPAALRIRRAFALSGVVPLGAFLVVHLAMNARALFGGWAFARAVDAMERVPGLPLVEAVFVFAPLLFHGALGLWLVVTRRSLAPSPYPPALRVAMHATGVGVLLFLALHLPSIRFHVPGTRLGGEELATLLDAQLSTSAHGVPWQGLVYLVGATCATLHFAAGLWGFYAMTAAGRESERRRRRAAWGALGLAVAMWAAFADVVVLRATGAPVIGWDASGVPATAPCPESPGP